MTNLVSAYMRNEIREFEKLLKQNSRTVMGDAFIKAYIDDLLKNIRTQVLLKVITPYTRIGIPFIASEINISAKEVEELLVALILDGQIDGQIDQLGQLLLLNKGPPTRPNIRPRRSGPRSCSNSSRRCSPSSRETPSRRARSSVSQYHIWLRSPGRMAAPVLRLPTLPDVHRLASPLRCHTGGAARRPFGQPAVHALGS